MIPFFYFLDNWFDWEENYWDLKILCSDQLIKCPRPFDGISKDYSCWYWYLWWWTEQFLEEIVQISVIFISNKSNSKKIKEWYHVSLTSNISGKTWSNCTCRGCFEIVGTSRFHNWFWKLSKIYGSNRAKQNTMNLFPLLYNCFSGCKW